MSIRSVIAGAIGIALMSVAQTAPAGLSADKPTVLITGANRGIGLEFVRQLAAADWNVIATARNPDGADELKALAKDNPRIVIEKLDVTDHPGMEALAAKYREQPIDLLLSNAGKTPRYSSAFKPTAGVDYDEARSSYEVNALAPLKLIATFMPNVEKSDGKKIVVISSKAGSFGEGPKMAMMFEYRASKAALNMIVYAASFETARKGIVLTALSPGTVATEAVEGELGFGQDMQMPGAIQPEDSVAGMLEVIDGLTKANNGQFLDYADGRLIPW